MKPWLVVLASPFLLSACSSCGKTTSDNATPMASSAASVLVDPNAAPDPECVKLCPINGRCKAKDGKCYAYREIDCVRCVGCKSFGACTLRDGACVAAKAEDCRRSTMCATNGQCTPKDGKCVKDE